MRNRKEDEDIGENVSAHNKTGVAFGREEAEIAVRNEEVEIADSDSIVRASERSVSDSTKEADGSSVFDAFEERLRKRREEDLVG